MLKADYKTRKALYAALVDSLSWTDLEGYAFERWTTYDRVTRKPRVTESDWDYAFAL